MKIQIKKSLECGGMTPLFSTRHVASNQSADMSAHSKFARAFSLLEVMIAIAVFFVGVFAILALVANSLRGARLLEKPMVDAGVVASQIAQTNSLIEVSGFGDLSEFLGDPYKGYTYSYDINEAATNKLFMVDVVVHNDAPGKPVISHMDVLLFRPQSPAGSMDGATVMKGH